MIENKKYNVVVFGTKEDTIIILDDLIKNDNKPNLVVTLDTTQETSYHISGKGDVYDWCKKYDVEIFAINDYTLSDSQCKEFFNNNEFDLGISYGWQRIIPSYVLDKFKFGIFGFHGSPLGLPYGKGRSPFNHSMIEGKKNIFNHFFKYLKGVDNGPFYSTTKFEINDFDTINSLNIKSLLIAKKEIKQIIKDYKSDNIVTTDQNDNIKETYYPKRTPKDGQIDLFQSTSDVYNFIRAISKPFPGAFLHTKLEKQKVTIWDAVPFDNLLSFDEFELGEIIDVVYDYPILKTMDGTLMIKEYEMEETHKLQKGDILI